MPVLEAYTPQSKLLAQLIARQNRPVHSVGEGFFNALGDIGAAYIDRKNMEREEKKEGRIAEQLAKSFSIATDNNMNPLRAQTMQGQFTPAQEAFPNGTTSAAEILAGQTAKRAQPAFDPSLTQPMQPAQRAAFAMQQLSETNPELAMQNFPAALQLANITAPKQPRVLPGMKPGDQLPILDADGNLTFKTAPGTIEAKTKNGTWVMSLSTGKPVMKTDEEVMGAPGEFAPVPTGMRVVADGNGGFEITTGGLESSITNPSKTKLEDVILNGRDTLAKMNQIKADFKPEYQQIGTRAEMMKYSAMAKAGIPLDPQAEKSLREFATYRRNAASNMNTAIKNATGVTVGKDEAPRLMNEIPNAGSGLFDGDDPVTFMAKIESTIQAITAANARAAYARRHGLDSEQQFAIPLSGIPDLIRQKGDQYKVDLKETNPAAPDSQLDEMVKARLREEFGL